MVMDNKLLMEWYSDCDHTLEQRMNSMMGTWEAMQDEIKDHEEKMARWKKLFWN